MKKYYNNFIHVSEILRKFDCVPYNKNHYMNDNFVYNDFNFFDVLYADLNNVYFKEKIFLKNLFKNFSNILEIHLSNMLDYKIKINVSNIKIQTYQNYFRNIDSLISFNCFKISSIKNFGFFIYSNNFILNMIELFFGSLDNCINKSTKYDVSYSQHFMNNNFIKILVKNISNILKKNLNFQISLCKLDSFFCKFNNKSFFLNDFFIVICLKLYKNNMYFNSFHICFPINFIKHINKIILFKSNKINEKFNIKKNFYVLNNIKFVMSAFLQNFYISLFNLYNLRNNCVIKIYNPNDVYVFIGKKLFFLGKNIIFKNNNSVLIKKRIYLKYSNYGENMNDELKKFNKYFSDSKKFSDNKENKIFSNSNNKDILEKDDLNNKINFIGDVEVKMSVRLGSINIKTKKLLSIKNGSILQLDQLAGEPLDILANGCLIAKGEIVVIKNKYGIRIVNILNNMNNLK
ncbi:flagellar motor switch protein FliN [Buchnera aphidicola (Astegopteryx bambusae)]|uniref:flagellar motor switch protein FliN n=1 Tax=Buchnera aphidicola TaxID=9 RepID=UPI0031B8AF96